MVHRWFPHPWPYPQKIIVVGNITLGGNAKSPCVLALTQALQQRGWRVGIVSRGYGARSQHTQPRLVDCNHDPLDYGEEAWWLAWRSGVPVVVAQQRWLAARWLAMHTDVTVIISDDGLQHYALPRHIECAMVNDRIISTVSGYAGFGTTLLREFPQRLQQVDFVIANALTAEANQDFQYRLRCRGYQFVSLDDHQVCDVDSWRQRFGKQKIHAIAAIARPQRFFTRLQTICGAIFEVHPFPDHYPFSRRDLVPWEQHCLVMTEKDAVKCRAFSLPNAWYLRLDAIVDAAFVDAIERDLNKV